MDKFKQRNLLPWRMAKRRLPLILLALLLPILSTTSVLASFRAPDPPTGPEPAPHRSVYVPLVQSIENTDVGLENAVAKQQNPTRTPRPTSTPVPIPPPTDYAMNNMMIVFGMVAVIVVIIGVWINREKP